MVIHWRFASSPVHVLVKEDINSNIKINTKLWEVSIDELRSGLNFSLPELIEEMRMVVAPISQWSPNEKYIIPTQNPGHNTWSK